MNPIRALAGRPLPALPSSGRDDVRAFLDGCLVDPDIAVPAIDVARREALRARLAGLRLEETHHLVEVDPTPGLAAAGIAADEADDRTRWRPRLIAHMCAISCSTRSSTLRKGSLHSTVRCA